MSKYRQIAGNADDTAIIHALLGRLWREIPSDLRVVLMALVNAPPCGTERDLARSYCVPYRTFKQKKARLLALAKKMLF